MSARDGQVRRPGLCGGPAAAIYLSGDRPGTAYPGLPWEPKAAFRTLADFGRGRSGRADGGLACAG